MRRTTPDLTGQRKTIYRTASAVLLGLTVLYALWTNYVAFVGGNLPLTPIDLGEGSTGFGLVMLAIGDLILVLVLWVVVDAVLLNLLHMVLLAGQRPTRSSSIPAQNGRSAGPAQQPWQQPGQPLAWQQGQPQQGQPQQGQGQPGQGQPWQGQPQQPWQGGGPSASAGPTLVGQGSPGWSPGPPNNPPRH